MKSTLKPDAGANDLVRLLTLLYDKWENGIPCYENPDDFEGYIGNAFRLTEDEETEILTILDQHGVRTAITARREWDAENAARP